VSYEFRKIYADLVTPDGCVLVVYQTWLTLWRRAYGSTGAELYRPDGRRSVLHGKGAPAPRDPDDPPDRLRVDTPDGPLDLELELEHGPVDPGPPEACPALRWRVLALRTSARARLPGGEALEGSGYADWVTLTRPTRALGLRTLRWGRAHAGDRSASFMDLALASGAAWQVGIERRGNGEARLHGSLTLALDGGDGEVGFGADGPRLALAARRELHRGSAFDPERVPDPLHRGVVAVLGGPHGERRWLAEARIDEAPGRALHEQVGFGRWAREVAGVVNPSAAGSRS